MGENGALGSPVLVITSLQMQDHFWRGTIPPEIIVSAKNEVVIHHNSTLWHLLFYCFRPIKQPGFDFCGSTSYNSSTSKAEIALNVVWHIRTGDVKLHAEPSYFHTVLKYLKLALSSSPSTSDNSTGNSTSPNYRLQLVFESQERVDFLENMFPDAIFNIGTLCV